MKLKEQPKLSVDSVSVEGATRANAQARVRRFAVLRAAQRAMAPSSRDPASKVDLAALDTIRGQLRGLVERFEEQDDGELGALEGSQDDLVELDRALDGYARLLLSKLDVITLAQLRASLSSESDASRTEMAALLELCMASEPTPSKYLAVVDLLITLLASEKRDGVWFVQTDPANLNDGVRQRCLEAGGCEPGVEAMILKRFQQAAQRLTREKNGSHLLREISAYKDEIAGFFFVSSVLRCVIGYNVVARNYFEVRKQAHRDADDRIDEEIGALVDEPGAEEAAVREPVQRLISPGDSPGVLAVQEAIQRRLAKADPVNGPAARLAANLDLSWLGAPERYAFLEAEDDELGHILRMTVVLGHLAMMLGEQEPDLAALGLHASQLDPWICALGEEVQSKINDLIRSDYADALHLGGTKSRFLQAVLLLARRRSDPARQKFKGSQEADSFNRDAISILREYLEREKFRKSAPMFLDLMGGGWHRTVALTAVGLMVAWVGLLHLEPAGERSVDNFSKVEAREVSPFLASAYRDHARQGSMFVATVARSWDDLARKERRLEAERILFRMLEKGVHEVLLYDPEKVLIGHYKNESWRTRTGWER